MDITTFISTLLNTEKQVSIPGLGIIRASEGPQADGKIEGNQQATDRFFPFLTGLTFSEKEQVRDGKLAKLVAEHRQISPHMAEYEVDKFVIRVKQELSRNGSFELPHVGMLSAGALGTVNFYSAFNDRALFGLSPVELKPLAHDNVVEAFTRKIGFKNVRKNKFRLVWAILIGLIILGLVSLLLVRLNMIGV